jgi:hypothetical protein
VEIRKWVKENKKTNIMVINLLARQDLELTSCVNQEKKPFYRKLGKYVKGLITLQ